MNKTLPVACLLTVAWCLPGSAAEKASASSRAYQFQREARLVLSDRGWHVSQDKAGQLVVNHPLGLKGAAVGGGKLELVDSPPAANAPFQSFAWLTLTFKPDSLRKTGCVANIVAYLYTDHMSQAEKKATKPIPFNNPDTTKEIQDIVAKAEQALVVKHPEYTDK